MNVGEESQVAVRVEFLGVKTLTPWLDVHDLYKHSNWFRNAPAQIVVYVRIRRPVSNVPKESSHFECSAYLPSFGQFGGLVVAPSKFLPLM